MLTGNGDADGRDLLIVDDDESQALLFDILLEKLGLPHRCHHAASGRQALELLRGEADEKKIPRPDLIILDLNMPGMDGCAVLSAIKADPKLRCIPVIMFSLGNNKNEIGHCYHQRANAYVRKPIDYESTLDVIRQIDRFWFHIATLPA